MKHHKDFILRKEMDLELRHLYDTEVEARQHVEMNEMVIPLYGVFAVKTERMLPDPPKVTSERTNQL